MTHRDMRLMPRDPWELAKIWGGSALFVSVMLIIPQLISMAMQAWG